MDVTNASVSVPDSACDVTESVPLDPLSDKGKQAFNDVIFGSVAGIVGKYVEYPFDTVKVRLQSQPEHLPLQYTGPLDCFRQSIKRDGVLGLYRGISAPLVGAAIETSSLFFSYQLAQNIYKATIFPPNQQLSMPALLICGAASGAFTSLLLTPIELIKCKMQVPLETPTPTIRYQGPLQLIASIYRHEGFMGFWHGQMGTLIRETGGSAGWFGSNEGMKLLFRKMWHLEADAPLPIWQQMCCGAVAGMTYNFVFYPADTIKSRMQTEGIGQAPGGKRTFWTVAKAFWRQQGLKGMYRGCGITVGRAAPSSAFIFTIHAELCRRFG